MTVLHIDLKAQGSDYAEFRFFEDNPNECQTRSLPLSQISELLRRSETSYYTRIPEEYAKTGQELYNWLDGSDRLLSGEIKKHQRSLVVLAISASQGLANLPWEILHDGTDFLLKRLPAIVPVRWLKDGKRRQLTVRNEPANRALNVLFMAASPRERVERELDFEAEEGAILKATQRTPLYLQVEESGWLQELGNVVSEKESGFFDIVHLSGHAEFHDKKPCLITETEFGDLERSSAEDIATKLQFQIPKLVFLSGCRTGYSWYSDSSAIPSMAETLLGKGATAILSWGNRVLDESATTAAAALYEALSQGKTVTEALALTYQSLIKNSVRDWHLLRFYVAETLPGSLKVRGRKRPYAPEVSQEFIDEEKRLRIPRREEFVGRRRQLQNCLRTLKTDDEKVGVLLHGMGGWGKTTIAARLCNRLSDYRAIVLWRQIDETDLVNKLADKLRDPQQRSALKQ